MQEHAVTPEHLREDYKSSPRTLPPITITILANGNFLARDWNRHHVAEGKTREEAMALLRSAPCVWDAIR